MLDPTQTTYPHYVMSNVLPDTVLVEVLDYLSLSDIPYGMLMMRQLNDPVEQRFGMSVNALRKLKSVISRMRSHKGADVSMCSWTRPYLDKASAAIKLDTYVRECLGEIAKLMECVKYLREIQLEPIASDRKIGCYYLTNDILDESEYAKWLLDEHIKMHYN